MAKYYYNGTYLPEIPAESLEKYPYAMLVHMTMPSLGYDAYSFVIMTCQSYVTIGEDGTTNLIPFDTSGLWCTYTYNPDTDSLDVETENETLEDFAFQIGDMNGTGTVIMELVWTNSDILNGSADSTEIYFAETEALSEDTKCRISLKTVYNLAASAKKLSGTTEPLSISEMIEIFVSAAGGELDYIINFHDSNNEKVSEQKIKKGASIYPPYDMQKWIDTNGTVLSFPYCPTENMEISCIPTTYAEKLYDFFKIDSKIYPYVILTCSLVSGTDPVLGVEFLDTIEYTEIKTSSYLNCNYVKFSSTKNKEYMYFWNKYEEGLTLDTLIDELEKLSKTGQVYSEDTDTDGVTSYFHVYAATNFDLSVIPLTIQPNTAYRLDTELSTETTTT